MAYATVYDMTWRSENARGTIELQTDGGVYDRGLYLVRGSLEIRNVLPDWDSQIVRQNCTFSVINTLDDYFDIVPLITMSNDKWKVVVKETYPDSAEHILFEGFLNVEAVSAALLDFAEVHFTASGYLSKLANIIPSSMNTIRIRSLIDIIADCLKETGVTSNIRVNSSLYEESSLLGAGQTLFNRVGTFNEAFWESDVERMNALDIISAILEPFCCYLYRWDGYWYIERYNNLVGTGGSVVGSNRYISRSYVEYNGSGGYDYADSGSVVNITLQDHSIHSLNQANTSQLLTVVPGIKQINIDIEKKVFTNAINPDLRYITNYSGIKPDPDLRQWEAYQYEAGTPTWTKRGEPYFGIKNAVLLTMANMGPSGNPMTTNHEGWQNGLATKFKAYINAYKGTDLVISWKFQVPTQGEGITWYTDYLPSGCDLGTLQDWMVQLTYSLKFYHNGSWYYVQSDGDEWSLVSYDDRVLQYIEISSAEVVKPNDWWSKKDHYAASISIPIGTFAATGGRDFVFCLGVPRWYHVDEPETGYVTGKVYFGDFSVVVSETEESTVITGGYSSIFYDEKDYSLQLFDSWNWNFRNALRYGASWESATLYWDDEEGTWHDSAEGGLWSDVSRYLHNLFLTEKFRLYHLSRQRQRFEFVSVHLFRPLQMFYDSKQSDKKFVLGSEIFHPEEDMHEVELWEYDSTTSITLTPEDVPETEEGRRGGIRRPPPSARLTTTLDTMRPVRRTPY